MAANIRFISTPFDVREKYVHTIVFFLRKLVKRRKYSHCLHNRREVHGSPSSSTRAEPAGTRRRREMRARAKKTCRYDNIVNVIIFDILIWIIICRTEPSGRELKRAGIRYRILLSHSLHSYRGMRSWMPFQLVRFQSLYDGMNERRASAGARSLRALLHLSHFTSFHSQSQRDGYNAKWILVLWIYRGTGTLSAQLWLDYRPMSQRDNKRRCFPIDL